MVVAGHACIIFLLHAHFDALGRIDLEAELIWFRVRQDVTARNLAI